MNRAPYLKAPIERYLRIGYPFRPQDEDARCVGEAVRAHARHTPTRASCCWARRRMLADMPWPDGSTVIAVDSSPAILRTIWPGNIPARRQAVQGDWRSLPVRDGACDLAIGDGSFNCLEYPGGMQAAASALKRTLHPDGLLVLRLFMRPDVCESPEELVRAAGAGGIETVHQFTFRLLMALQRRVHDGIAVRDVYRYWNDAGLREDALPAIPGLESRGRADDRGLPRVLDRAEVSHS
jgi:SAM-dependent methyltransferase